MTATERRMIARLAISDFDALERQARRKASDLEAEISALTAAGVAEDDPQVVVLREAVTAAIQRADRFSMLLAAAEDDADGTYDL